jgi:hypothetical protein
LDDVIAVHSTGDLAAQVVFGEPCQAHGVSLKDRFGRLVITLTAALHEIFGLTLILMLCRPGHDGLRS